MRSIASTRAVGPRRRPPSRRTVAGADSDQEKSSPWSGAIVSKGIFFVAVKQSVDITIARLAVLELATTLGFPLTDRTMIATAVSEVARNIDNFAGHGEIHVAVEDREGRPALVIQAVDDGPGIPDIQRALEDGYSTGRGLGLGLPGARRLMDRLVIESNPGAGTFVEMWKWIPYEGSD
ncbi:ATP-binding protein [Nocardia uniformis]|uniref:ATP-binding protein n=1 Tax=Nocardia uniformis TaxID=53432 RepID=A0A849C5B9_9NOCA|nr:ATP-binding protein [Nocardia uniformis]